MIFKKTVNDLVEIKVTWYTIHPFEEHMSLAVSVVCSELHANIGSRQNNVKVSRKNNDRLSE